MSDKKALLKEIVNDRIKAHKKAKDAANNCYKDENCSPQRLKELRKIEKKKLEELKAAGKTLKPLRRKKRPKIKF